MGAQLMVYKLAQNTRLWVCPYCVCLMPEHGIARGLGMQLVMLRNAISCARNAISHT